MKTIITGGAGFIGSHLSRKLLDTTSDTIVVYDNFSSGKQEYIPEDNRVTTVKGDIKDLSTLTNAMQGADRVFHLAANPDIAKATTQPDIDFWEGTYLGQNILEAMRQTNTKRIFYTSGSGVYGDHPETTFDENYGPCIPISTYGASKLAVEALIAAYTHMFGIKATIFRFANVVGPRQTHGVGYDFVAQLKKNPSKLKVLGDGSQSKSYIHISDILNAIWCTFDQTERIDLFNVGTEDYITVAEIAEIAACLAGNNTSITFSEGSRGWKGDVPIIRFGCSKIKTLGWKNRLTSSEAIKSSIESML